MVIKGFPPIKTASPEGLLAVGGDLDISSLKLAYENGIFPWPTEDFPLLWFAPPQRAILEFKNLKIPKRLKRDLKNMDFDYKIDGDFPLVIQNCAEGLTRNSSGTWITPAMVRAYTNFHRAGFAHSFECYNSKNQLVGGLYGVSLGNMFVGESMFFLETGASKAALIFACRYLEEKRAEWMDVQMMSPLLANFGAQLIPRAAFMKKLKEALIQPPLFPTPEKLAH